MFINDTQKHIPDMTIMYIKLGGKTFFGHDLL